VNKWVEREKWWRSRDVALSNKWVLLCTLPLIHPPISTHFPPPQKTPPPPKHFHLTSTTNDTSHLTPLPVEADGSAVLSPKNELCWGRAGGKQESVEWRRVDGTTDGENNNNKEKLKVLG